MLHAGFKRTDPLSCRRGGNGRTLGMIEVVGDLRVCALMLMDEFVEIVACLCV